MTGGNTNHYTTAELCTLLGLGKISQTSKRDNNSGISRCRIRDEQRTHIQVKLTFGRGKGAFLADAASGHRSCFRAGITEASIREKVRQAGASYHLIPNHGGPALQANDRLFGAFKGMLFKALRAQRGIGGPPRRRLALASRPQTRGGNTVGLTPDAVFEVVVDTWQKFPLRLVTAAWATTLTTTVTLDKIRATLQALPVTVSERGQLVDVSSEYNLRQALKELDTLYREAVEFGVHRPSSSGDRRSAFEAAFQESLAEHGVGRPAAAQVQHGGASGSAEGNIPPGDGGGVAGGAASVVASLRAKRLRRVSPDDDDA